MAVPKIFRTYFIITLLRRLLKTHKKFYLLTDNSQIKEMHVYKSNHRKCYTKNTLLKNFVILIAIRLYWSLF